MPFNRPRLAVACLIGAATLSGCIVAPPRERVVYAPGPSQAPAQQEMVYAEVAPPLPQAEVVGVAPPGFFWISGLWFWQGGRHVWRPGHWEAHRPGYQWTPHQWVPSGRGWQLRGGFWAAHR